MENKKIDVADLVPYLGQVVRIGSEHVRLHAILADGVVEAPQGYYRKAAEVALLEVTVPEFVDESGPVGQDGPVVDTDPLMGVPYPEPSSAYQEPVPVAPENIPVQPEISEDEHELKPLATGAPAAQSPDKNFSF